MGYEIFCDTRQVPERRYCLICNTSDVAFGPIFWESDDIEGFLDWIGADPRQFSTQQLQDLQQQWREQKAEDAQEAQSTFANHDGTFAEND